MSLIVSRSPPLIGSVSSSKERRWISIRCGTSSGLSRREKLLRGTGAAFERAKVGDSSDSQRDVNEAQIWAGAHSWRATAKHSRRSRPAPGLAPGAGSRDATYELFELDGSAGLLELGFEFLTLVALDALFDR